MGYFRTWEDYNCSYFCYQLITFTLVKKSWMNQKNAYSNECKVKYLLKSKTSVHMVELVTITWNFPLQFQKHLVLQPRERVFSWSIQLFFSQSVCYYFFLSYTTLFSHKLLVTKVISNHYMKFKENLSLNPSLGSHLNNKDLILQYINRTCPSSL